METASDYALTLALVPAIYFALSYGLGSPWYRSALGVVTFAYALSMVLLLALIAYAIITGGRIEEGWRLSAGLAILAALTGKVIVLHVERYHGRLLRSTPTERKFSRDNA